MTPSFASSLDASAGWRSRARRAGSTTLTRFLADHELRRRRRPRRSSTRCASAWPATSWSLAFVAEFSRGKSELINAIFFADAGRRVLPATPGRTTMCPVELAWDAGEPPALSLLPIETRLEGLSLGRAARRSRAPGRASPLDVERPDAAAAGAAAK